MDNYENVTVTASDHLLGLPEQTPFLDVKLLVLNGVLFFFL
jgi:hypothetical protein